MNSERDLRENKRILIPSQYRSAGKQSQQVLRGNYPTGGEGSVEQDANIEHTTLTSQSFLGDLDPQEIEGENDPVEDDPELATIAAQLRETASYAINLTFKEELRKKLLQQFVEHRTGETN